MEEEGSNEYMMPPDDAAAAAGSNGMGDPSAAAMVENNGMMESNSFMSMNEDHMTHVYQVRIHPPPPFQPLSIQRPTLIFLSFFFTLQ